MGIPVNAAQALDTALRSDPGRLLSVLIHRLGDFDLAEEVLQDAAAVALEKWPHEGIPDNPAGWLIRTARRRAVDKIRRAGTWARKADDLKILTRLQAMEDGETATDDAIPDERLALIFTCCHPALNESTRVALTLQTLGGLTVPEIARAFLTAERTMAQRLVRAKRKIRDAGIPYAVPGRAHMPERLAGVMAVLYLIFNESYAATSGADYVRTDLAAEAIRLARLLTDLLPQESEPLGLLALMLFHDARRAGRLDETGGLLLLADQDRSQWDRARIRDANAHLAAALRLGSTGPYQLQAAIAGLHANAPSAAETNWPQIAACYAQLYDVMPTPVVALNRTVAIAMAEGPEAGLAYLDTIPALEGYHLYHSTRGELLRRLGRDWQALECYRAARDCTASKAERRFIERRIRTLEGKS